MTPTMRETHWRTDASGNARHPAADESGKSVKFGKAGSTVWEGDYKHRRDDLIEELLYELHELDKGEAKILEREHSEAYGFVDRVDGEGVPVLRYEYPELADAFVTALEETINEHAPQFHTFHGEDGAWGYHLDEDMLADSIYDHETVRVGPEGAPSYILVESDHGNLTLLAVTTREIW